MRPISLLFLLVAGGLLAACATKSYPPSGSAAAVQQPAPAAGGEALAPPGSTERAVAPSAGSGSQEGGWVSRYPYGATQQGETAEVPPAGNEQSRSPNGSDWKKPNVTDEERTADIEACYNYAWSQVERDMKIDSDVATGDFNNDYGLGFNQLTKRMRQYEYRNRRTELMNSCMQGKGYSKG